MKSQRQDAAVKAPSLTRDCVNEQMIAKAHRRFMALIEAAHSEKLYGTVGIEAVFEAGRITTIRRQLAGTEK